jgi:hypothetical protein
MTKSPWFDRAFGSLYPILYAHRDGDSATDEVAFVRKMLELSPLHQVIDLDAFEDLPLDMRQRLAGGERTGE